MTLPATKTVDEFVTRFREKVDCCEFGEATDENVSDQVIVKCSSSPLRRRLLNRGRGLTLNNLQTVATAMEASDRHAGSMEKPQGKPGLNVIRGKPAKRCCRCDHRCHMQDKKKCHKVGQFARCCKTKKIKGLSLKHPSKSKEHQGNVNQMNSRSDREYAFSIVDEKQPLIS